MDERVPIPESDDALLAECEVSAFRSSGAGGQSVNTADSAVRLKHLPSGIVVVGRRERSQLLNKRDCLARLRKRLMEQNAALDVPKRIPTRKSRGAKERQLRAKHLRSRVKHTRGRVRGSDE